MTGLTETITTREVARHQYVATSRGHRGASGKWIIGPVLVDVVIYNHQSDQRPTITPTYSVEVDGVHRFGGPAAHVTDEYGAIYTDRLGRPGRWPPAWLLLWGKRQGES